jgi:hypothetical protein
MEAAELAIFMVSASVFTILLPSLFTSGPSYSC